MNNPMSGTDPTGYSSKCSTGTRIAGACGHFSPFESVQFSEQDKAKNNGHDNVDLTAVGPGSKGLSPEDIKNLPPIAVDKVVKGTKKDGSEFTEVHLGGTESGKAGYGFLGIISALNTSLDIVNTFGQQAITNTPIMVAQPNAGVYSSLLAGSINSQFIQTQFASTSNRGRVPIIGVNFGKILTGVARGVTLTSVALTVKNNYAIGKEVGPALGVTYLAGDLGVIAASAGLGGPLGLGIGLGFSALGGSHGVHNKVNAISEYGRNSVSTLQNTSIPPNISKRVFFPDVPQLILNTGNQ